MIKQILFLATFLLLILGSCKKKICKVYDSEGNHIGTCSEYSQKSAEKNCGGIQIDSESTVICED